MAGGRFRELLKKYGKVALGVRLSVSAASITASPEAQVSNPEMKPRNRTAELAASSGGALALAVLCNKALFPIRVPITIAVTPPIARFLARRQIIKTSLNRSLIKSVWADPNKNQKLKFQISK
ncbi:hypothetical protein R6Q59_028380 [Mikania micrantha]